MAHVMNPAAIDGIVLPPVTSPPALSLATPEAAAAAAAEAAALTQAPAPAAPAPRVFTEEELEAARRQEKDKLYPKLSKMEEQLAQFEQERAERQRIDAERAHQEAEERRLREEAEMSAKDLLLKKEDEWKSQFNSAQAEWEQKFSKLQEESEARAALLQRERDYQELVSYKNRRIAEEQENLYPDLIDMISGNTPEEIEASISLVAAKSSAILSSIQQVLPQQQQRPRGISPTGGTPMGPLDTNGEQQVLTLRDIQDMSMSEYEQHRARLMAAASGRSR